MSPAVDCLASRRNEGAFSLVMRMPYAMVLAAVIACAPPPPPPRPPPPRPPPVATVEPAPPPPPAPPSTDLERLLRAEPELLPWLDGASKRRLQILVSVPVEREGKKLELRRLGFRLGAEYFYPASAVKTCAAYGVADKIQDLRKEAGKARPIDFKTPVRFTEGEGRAKHFFPTTLRRELEKALVLSDNDAHNRLFDFVGRDELAERLSRIGVRSARLVQYLGNDAELRVTPVIELMPRGQKSFYVAQRLGFEPPPPPGEPVLLGQAHVTASGIRVPRPMDFSPRNAIPVRELQDVLVAITRPDLVEEDPRPRPLDKADRAELLAILSSLPSDLPRMAKSRTLDAMQKPLHIALKGALPGHKLKIYSKGGRAYGFSVENAYVVDETTHRSVFVTATIYANQTETLNDDRYEYEAVASPFIEKLGAYVARSFLASAPALD
jgi:hypothetical protein